MFFNRCLRGVSLSGSALLSFCILAVALEAPAQVVSITDFDSIGRSVQRSTITEYKGSLIFSVGVNDTNQREIWSFDGAETKRVAAGFIGDSEIAVNEFTEFQDRLYFSADGGTVGHELYRFDGNSVSLAVDIETGTASSYPVNLVTHNNALYFSAKDGASFNSLYKYDGSEVSQVARFDDPRASVVTGVTYQGDLYFGADDFITGMELWKYDGNEVQMVSDVNSGPGDSYPRNFQVVGDDLFFKATTSSGQEVWKFDGETTSILEDVNPGPESSDPRYMREVNGELMFSAVRNRRRQVFVSDGETVESLVTGGGPIAIGEKLYTIRGRREGRTEINDLYDLNGEFYRSTVESAGPFITYSGSLFFSCSCSDKELYMLADAGDTDSDGAVTFSDFLTLAESFGGGGGWKAGDSDGDGQITFEDFLMQADNFGGKAPKKSMGTSLSSPASVPEPAGLSLAVLGCVLLVLVRRKSR